MSVVPPAWRSSHLKSATAVACPRCHCAPLAKRTTRTSTSALGFSSATRCMCGMASRTALLRAWIFPCEPIEPEQSAIQMKCNGRVMLPAGSSDHCGRLQGVISRGGQGVGGLWPGGACRHNALPPAVPL